MSCTRCQPSTTPNSAGSCLVCGKSLPVRSPAFERDFLQGATRAAGLGALPFADHVADRLTEGQRMYGVKALLMSLAEGIRELHEEGLDLGSWSVLIAQGRDIQALPEEQRHDATLLLQMIAGKGCEVEYLIRQLREVLSP